MQYINSSVRRQDRLLEHDNAIRLLETGEYGVLSLSTPEGAPYGLPLNYVWDGEKSVYFHCAIEGQKLVMIKNNSKASFCVVGTTNVVPQKFSTGYESIILKGSIAMGLSDDEKLKGLQLLVNKYSPNHKPAGQKYIENLFHETEVLRFDAVEFSGKCKRIV